MEKFNYSFESIRSKVGDKLLNWMMPQIKAGNHDDVRHSLKLLHPELPADYVTGMIDYLECCPEMYNVVPFKSPAKKKAEKEDKERKITEARKAMAADLDKKLWIVYGITWILYIVFVFINYITIVR